MMRSVLRTLFLMVLALLMFRGDGGLALAQSQAEEEALRRIALATIGAALVSRSADKVNGPCSNTTYSVTDDNVSAQSQATVTDSSCDLNAAITVMKTTAGNQISGIGGIGTKPVQPLSITGTEQLVLPGPIFPFEEEVSWLNVQSGGALDANYSMDIPWGMNKLRGFTYTHGQATGILTQQNTTTFENVLRQTDMVTLQMTDKNDAITIDAEFLPYGSGPFFREVTVNGTGRRGLGIITSNGNVLYD